VIGKWGKLGRLQLEGFRTVIQISATKRKKTIMASNFKFKLLSQLSKKRQEEGFTLIELLVVVIIIGILAAVALPNLLGQVGKARETEGKNAIGTINRSQQGYHLEKRLFTSALTNPQLAANNVLGVTASSKFYTFAVATGSDASSTNTGVPVAAQKDGVRAFSGGIGFDSSAGAYSDVLCQTDTITATPATITVTSGVAQDCPSGSTNLRK
jgi:prepilin-type N-terminal cleavage/methylation domain-containing protein